MRLPQPLLSRTLDPLLGVFTGFLAYYLHENHPRTALPQEQRLAELVRWKWLERNDRAEAMNSQEGTK